MIKQQWLWILLAAVAAAAVQHPGSNDELEAVGAAADPEWWGGVDAQEGSPVPAAIAALPACPPGQGRPTPTEACQLCPYGRYSPGGRRGPCLTCPAGTVTITPGATGCGCRPGTGTLTINSGPCQPCPTGTYSPGGSMSPCMRCPGSAFMVTPPQATRVNQCTCQAGYGSTPDFPRSCQMCPRGTYADALSEIDYPGVPTQGGKGITNGLVGATFRPCKPCCPGGVGTCGLSTRRPGARAYSQCELAEPIPPPFCCGGRRCRTPVPRPPQRLPSAARAAATAAAQRNFRQMYAGSSVVIGPAPSRLTINGSRKHYVLSGRRVQRLAGGNSNTRGGDEWDSRDGASWGSSSSGSSRSWGASLSGDESWSDEDSGVSGDTEGTISSTEPAAWSGVDASVMNICEASPRLPVTNAFGLAGNTPLVVSYWGDGSPEKTCEFVYGGTANLGAAAVKLVALPCTGNQIAPYLVLTGGLCVDATLMRTLTECPQLYLANVELCYGVTSWDPENYSCNTAQGQTLLEAVGASYFPREKPHQAYDYAIIFTDSPRPGPYYEYNYVENFPIPTTAGDMFEALSYSNTGVDAPAAEGGRCGCKVCNMPCGLSRSGPAPGPLQTGQDTEGQGNGAVSADLEACDGGQGSCMTVNGRSCCIGVFSYEAWKPDRTLPVCDSACGLNYWSAIRADAPLTALWSNVTVGLPQ